MYNFITGNSDTFVRFRFHDFVSRKVRFRFSEIRARYKSFFDTYSFLQYIREIRKIRTTDLNIKQYNLAIRVSNILIYYIFMYVTTFFAQNGLYSVLS